MCVAQLKVTLALACIAHLLPNNVPTSKDFTNDRSILLNEGSNVIALPLPCAHALGMDIFTAAGPNLKAIQPIKCIFNVIFFRNNCLKQLRENVYSTRYSQTVTHQGTNRAERCLLRCSDENRCFQRGMAVDNTLRLMKLCSVIMPSLLTTRYHNNYHPFEFFTRIL